MAGKRSKVTTGMGQYFLTHPHREQPVPQILHHKLKKTLMRFMASTLLHTDTQRDVKMSLPFFSGSRYALMYRSFLWRQFPVTNFTHIMLPDHFLVPSFHMYGFLSRLPPRITHGHVVSSQCPCSIKAPH